VWYRMLKLQLFTSVLQCVAVCCSVLQCVAVCCSVLQCVAMCCRYGILWVLATMEQEGYWGCLVLFYSVYAYTVCSAYASNLEQHTTKRFNTLQHSVHVPQIRQHPAYIYMYANCECQRRASFGHDQRNFLDFRFFSHGHGRFHIHGSMDLSLEG